MSGTAGAEPPTAVLGFGLEILGRWHPRSVQNSRAVVQTYLLTSSVQPPPTAGGDRRTRSPLRLPSLVATPKGPHRQISMARLSLSEPSLLTPNEVVLLEGFSNKRRQSLLQKQPPPTFSQSSIMLTSKTSYPSRTSQLRQQQNHQQVQSCTRPTFIHLSQAIQPRLKPRPFRHHSYHPVLTTEIEKGDLQPSSQRRNSSFQGEPLSVIGKPCPLSCSHRTAVTPATGPARTQLHVFLPTEAEGEEVDKESVDEGFMDEFDCKIASLKLQQEAPKTCH